MTAARPSRAGAGDDLTDAPVRFERAITCTPTGAGARVPGLMPADVAQPRGFLGIAAEPTPHMGDALKHFPAPDAAWARAYSPRRDLSRSPEIRARDPEDWAGVAMFWHQTRSLRWSSKNARQSTMAASGARQLPPELLTLVKHRDPAPSPSLARLRIPLASSPKQLQGRVLPVGAPAGVQALDAVQRRRF